MFRWILVLGVAAWGSTAIAAEAVRYAPPPDWVHPAPIPDIPPGKDGAAVQTLLLDSQSRFGPDRDEFYAESAVRLQTPQGVASAATLPISWSPDTETVTLHRMAIIRDGKSIDLLAGGKNVTVLRREGKLELSMLDGRLTATVQPEGLRVGDIIDIAMTLERHDPVFQGRSQALSIMRFPGVAGRVRLRAIWPAGKPVAWRTTEGFPKLVVSHPDGGTEVLADGQDLTAPKPPENAPERFSEVGVLELSQFQSWAEVSALMAPLYRKAATLAPDSPLHAEAARIRAASSDPKARAEAALRLVEDQVHYVSLAMNFGGYVPADADLTWSRRFGDCKGKTTLLLALLHELGIEAQPALVNTTDGDALPL
ncbi:DUF3857 domain-containing protein, partial [Phenylobacterium sp.]|uniref:DUF3857 domain-containing protein n=1 Tax=Phenylobacterium sp. TaxID=1871053 RepID=UPI002F3F4B92